MRVIYIFLAISFLLGQALDASAGNLSRKEYIEKYKHIAIRQMNQYGIPASIIMAQACLESGNGNSRLAVKANNHFGIKCHNWNGKRIYHDDDQRGECFRKYNEAEDSFKDHSEFLRNGKRYQSLFDLKRSDYRSWAHGLKAAGYATDPQYAQMLIEIIEKNNLYLLDSEVSSFKEGMELSKERRKLEKQNRKSRKSIQAATAPQFVGKGEVVAVAASTIYNFSLDRQIYSINGVPYVIATGNESYASIAREYSLFTKELLKFNDLKREESLPAGTIVYISSKKKEGEKGAYVVQPGDTMYGISQKLGIRLLKLYELNGMKYGSEAEPGKMLNLQK